MSTELQAPFGLTPSGGVAVVTDPGIQAQQHLQSLVSTNPGERVMLSTYGVPVMPLLFGVDSAQISSMVAQQVRGAVQQWEPAIAVQNVQSVVSDTSEGVAQVNVTYTPGAGVSPQAQAQTATVLIGGAVVS